METLPRRGYRFIAHVDGVRTDQGVLPAEGRHVGAPLRKRWLLALAGVGLGALVALLFGLNVGGLRNRILGRDKIGKIQSLAVLPLENLSRDPDQEYFAEGMTDALITELGKLGALRVISRTSVMQYKGAHKPLGEIARELNVDAVVEGTVLHWGNRVRITAQLIRARATEKHLWAESYESDLIDVLRLQGEVARAIATQIRIKLSPQEQVRMAASRPVDRETYEAYLKGRFYWNKRTNAGTRKAIEYFQRAIERDAGYAPAYAGLADSYIWLSILGGAAPKESYPRAKATALKALELDDTLAEAHTSLAQVLQHYEWDRAGAQRELDRAMELNPNYAFTYAFYSMNLAYLGRMEESIAAIKRWRELDPLSIPRNNGVAVGFMFARQYDQAIAESRKAIELDPSQLGPHLWLGRAYEQEGRYAEALAEIKKGATLIPGEPNVAGALGHVYALLGQRGEAEKRIDELKELAKHHKYVPPYQVALIYTALGEKDRAFEWLERAYEARDDGFLWCIELNPMWDSLRSDPRFADLVRRFRSPQ